MEDNFLGFLLELCKLGKLAVPDPVFRKFLAAFKSHKFHDINLSSRLHRVSINNSELYINNYRGSGGLSQRHATPQHNEHRPLIPELQAITSR